MIHSSARSHPTDPAQSSDQSEARIKIAPVLVNPSVGTGTVPVHHDDAVTDGELADPGIQNVVVVSSLTTLTGAP